MLDAERAGGSDCASASEPDPDRASRRQYTLKGVEAEAIALMRDAARQEGMKIGSWVSLRMREAAEKALRRKPEAGLIQSTGLRRSEGKDESGQNDLVRELSARLLVMEQELRELSKAQMAVMAKLISQS
ncbi:MAG TPA: hypothetical protein VK533_09520 [Sphingomonas sp.]|uniref:hypothetical protein n=1 Tax=Sphingomonas sp. TaxID=28214 RepID=UPI002D0177A9|nr:hypothetical protein [Sphingomonas sp.]HMI19771.1 hypothetical protein [Sphingomonas sp.]